MSGSVGARGQGLGWRLGGVGLALGMAGAAVSAEAAEIVISDARTEAVATSTIDAGAPGDIAISDTGSVDVTTGAAVALDSDNTVANDGAIRTNEASDTIGVRISGGFTGAFTNTGAISLLEDFSGSDSDGDGDFDTPFASGTNRIGVLLTGAGAFTGDIVNASDGVITIEGNDSAGIRVETDLIGNLTNEGMITVLGDRGVGVDVTGAVSGDVLLGGLVVAQGADAIAANLAGPISGGVRVLGALTATGYRSNFRPSDDETLAELDADDTLQSGSALLITADIGGGVVIAGVGVEDDVDDDGDGLVEDIDGDGRLDVDEDANANGVLDTGEDLDGDGTLDVADDDDDDAFGALRVDGGAPAVLIAADGGGPVTLSASTFGFGLVNRGSITANGVFDGVAATGVRLAGDGANTVTSEGGVLNDGVINVFAYAAEATGIDIAAGAVAEAIVNRGSVSASLIEGPDATATAVLVGAGASTSRIENTGLISAESFDAAGDAVAIRDRTGGVTELVNTGAILAEISVDEDETISGNAIAIDFSANTSGVSFTQRAPDAFTDDDAIDDGLARPADTVTTQGSVLLGSGNDVVELLAGRLNGSVFFGGGTDSLLIDGDATLSGNLVSQGGSLSVSVDDGVLSLGGGVSDVANVSFGAGSELVVRVEAEAGASTLLTATGAVDFAPGAVITPVLPLDLDLSGETIFLTAGALTGAENVERSISGPGVPFVYNFEIARDQTNANALELRYGLKSTDALGLDANEAAAFDQTIIALQRDAEAEEAFLALDEEAEFEAAYADLLPNYADAAAELATTAIAETQAATQNRLHSARLGDVRGRTVWLQEVGFTLKRVAEDEGGIDYEGLGFGFALGVDAPLRPGLLAGLLAGASVGLVVTEVDESSRGDGNVSATFGQVNGYIGGELGPIDWDAIVGAGFGSVQSTRQVQIGPDFLAEPSADWNAYEGHGALRVSAPARFGRKLAVVPFAEATYVGLSEAAYEEAGGGEAVDLAVDEAFTQRLWAEAGVELRTALGRVGAEWVPAVSFAYRTDVLDESSERTVRFVSGDTPFTLTDASSGDGAPVLGLSLSGGGAFSTVSVRYEGEFGDVIDRHSLNASVRFRF